MIYDTHLLIKITFPLSKKLLYNLFCCVSVNVKYRDPSKLYYQQGLTLSDEHQLGKNQVQEFEVSFAFITQNAITCILLSSQMSLSGEVCPTFWAICLVVVLPIQLPSQNSQYGCDANQEKGNFCLCVTFFSQLCSAILHSHWTATTEASFSLFLLWHPGNLCLSIINKPNPMFDNLK